MSRAANYGPRTALYAGGGFGGAPCHAVPAIVRRARQPSGKSELREHPARFSKLPRTSCKRGSTGGQGEGRGRAAAPAHEDEDGSFTPCHREASPAAVSAPGDSRPSISIQHLSRLSPGAIRWRAQRRPTMPSAHTRGSPQLSRRHAGTASARGEPEAGAVLPTNATAQSVLCRGCACLLSLHLYALAICATQGIKLF